SLHAGELNPGIDWDRSPFRVQREASPWPEGLPLRAAISSFGAGGANAHAVVEAGPPPSPPASPDGGPHLVVLSARSEERLREVVGRLLAFVRVGLASGRPARLADVAYTLQVGREAMRERLAVVVEDEAELEELLARAAAGEHDHPGLL